MPIKIDSRKRNDLLKRDECLISIEHMGKPTPKRAEMTGDVAKELKKPEDCIIIDKIFTEFGKPVSRVKVQAYDKKEYIPKKKIEKMEIRISGPKKKVAAPVQAEKPAEAKVEAKPAEKTEKGVEPPAK